MRKLSDMGQAYYPVWFTDSNVLKTQAKEACAGLPNVLLVRQTNFLSDRKFGLPTSQMPTPTKQLLYAA